MGSSIARILIHGLILAVADIGGVVAGFVLFYRIPVNERIPFQLATALVFVVAAFLIWKLLVDCYFPRIALAKRGELVWVWLASPVLLAVVFVPVHYVTSGYVTKLANIALGCGLALPANAAALSLATAHRGSECPRVEP